MHQFLLKVVMAPPMEYVLLRMKRHILLRLGMMLDSKLGESIKTYWKMCWKWILVERLKVDQKYRNEYPKYQHKGDQRISHNIVDKGSQE